MTGSEFDKLRDIAIWLEGLKKGQGNLEPLGNIHLETLWNVIEKEKMTN